MSLNEKLIAAANKSYNVLLVGRHGVGKTTMVQHVSDVLKINMKYYSASTLDPYIDVIGVPVPNMKDKTLEFFRTKELENAEFIFFDELNRATPRVLNAVLEIVQFKRVNGVPLPKLKMVWAAINPSGEDYDVEDLDPALLDRFHLYFTIKASFNMEYMKTKMDENVAKALRGWWDDDLGKEQRAIVTPRRLEYIGMLIKDEIDWTDALPTGGIDLLPRHLSKRLSQVDGSLGDLDYTKEAILENPEVFVKKIKTDPPSAIKIKSVIGKASVKQLFAARDVLEAMPGDLVMSIGGPKFPGVKREMLNSFSSNGIDLGKYPKIFKAFTHVKK